MRDDKGKRMELGREAGSGPFRCFLRHRGKNAAIFGGGRSEAFLSTATEAFNEERMNAPGRLAVCRLEITRAAKISQGHGFHQEQKTTNRLFRNKGKQRKSERQTVWLRLIDVSAGSKTRKEIWQVDFKRRHSFLLACNH